MAVKSTALKPVVSVKGTGFKNKKSAWLKPVGLNQALLCF